MPVAPGAVVDCGLGPVVSGVPMQSSEPELLRRARDGDHAALSEVLRSLQGRVYRVCLRMVSHRDDAAELTQDVLLKVCQGIREFKGDAELTTWATRIAMNHSISHLRKRRLRQTTSLDGWTPNGEVDADDQATALRARLADGREPGPADRVEQGEEVRRLQRAIAELDEEFRAVLVLRDIEELDYAQIARVLELPVGTVKSRLFRARLALRERMAEVKEGRPATPARPQ